MDDSNFNSIYTYGDFGMNRISNSICTIGKNYPWEFYTYIYFIFPTIIYTLELIFINHITNFLYIQNSIFILIGLNIISILIVISISCGIVSVYELYDNGDI